MSVLNSLTLCALTVCVSVLMMMTTMFPLKDYNKHKFSNQGSLYDCSAEGYKDVLTNNGSLYDCIAEGCKDVLTDNGLLFNKICHSYSQLSILLLVNLIWWWYSLNLIFWISFRKSVHIFCQALTNVTFLLVDSVLPSVFTLEYLVTFIVVLVLPTVVCI